MSQGDPPAWDDGAEPLADIEHLTRRRDLNIPEEDRGALSDYWRRLRVLRARIDERALADAELAVTWTAVPSEVD